MLQIRTILSPLQVTTAMKALPNIPGFELLSCLGGGMLTSVYSAHDLQRDTTCAVKVLRPDWQDHPVAVKLLQREARACLAVKHPNLVTLSHAHVTRPPYFIVMDMLPGESLRRRLRRDYQVEVGEALWIVRQVVEALAALHRKGFVHGDIKPDNIRITDEGKATLLDLGFAHRPGENAMLLEQGYVLGTVNYLAPELCHSKQPLDDLRSDVFSLGVTLFELIAGQLPYEPGNTNETMHRHMTERPRDIGTLGLPLPRALPHLLERMMTHNPLHRPRASALIGEFINLEISSLCKQHVA